jgi:hypothetical protein
MANRSGVEPYRGLPGDRLQWPGLSRPTFEGLQKHRLPLYLGRLRPSSWPQDSGEGPAISGLPIELPILPPKFWGITNRTSLGKLLYAVTSRQRSVIYVEQLGTKSGVGQE